jgi:predicted MFS family arabinose efflux permease
VLRGIEGFGAHSRIHTRRLVELSSDLPVVVEIVDEEAKVAAFLPTVETMVPEGLVTWERVHAILYRHRGDDRYPGVLPGTRQLERGSAVATWVLPASATADAGRLVAARALRGFVDGAVSVLLASYLTDLGFSPVQVGAIVTGTLLGSAALTLAVGLLGDRLRRRRLLLGACGLMAFTGLGFAGMTEFWPLFLVAVVGTLNPSAGDVSVFLSTEQALLPDTVAARERTALFARFNLAGTLAGAAGALVSGVPVALAERQGWDLLAAQRAVFLLYAAVALLVAGLYRGLSPAVERARPPVHTAPLATSRRLVLRLSALFSLDSLGGGFVVQSLLALWLFRRFDLSVQTAGAFFFVAGLLSAFSQLLAGRLAARIGLINTMVYTHLPSNAFLILAALMPTAPLAIALLLLRMSLSQMDVPARQSYVMAVVPPAERAAAASVTNVPRSLAAALTPLAAGALLSLTSFGWPLVLGGLLKGVYDLLLLAQFRAVKPPEEQRA